MSSAPLVSVIICAHNSRPEYLEQTFAALRAQTLPVENWEVLLVDNASSPPLQFAVDWHPRARLYRENQLGLTHARVSGIRETTAPLLLFVDDDNVLNRDYLAEALRLAVQWPQLGAWGGQCHPRFETPPPAWTETFWRYLAIREFTDECWSNLLEFNAATPLGAGLCVRREVAERYVVRLAEEPRLRELDRRGTRLTGAGDLDLALSACELGMGTGVFPSLELDHLIAARRLTVAYLREITFGAEFSFAIFNFLLTGRRPDVSRLDGLFLRLKYPRLSRQMRIHALARWRGLMAAKHELARGESVP